MIKSSYIFICKSYIDTWLKTLWDVKGLKNKKINRKSKFTNFDKKKFTQSFKA